ncbi:MAG: helix-turn-helix transcriptional regulator [Solirubrobacterales bacterium]|nr:helix-turn-helix transcriptional regulator [Solirubrobacterales bacterium]MBV9166769.1 helix-turn-helix transcriptional regulator [Solirubrobacterales bacterium]
MNGFQGQLEGLLLAILQQGPLHGYAIASELRARSGGAFEVPEGTLYPVLHKLEKEGLVRSRWEKVSGRRRRVYAASPQSQNVLRERFESWQRLSRAIDSVFGPAPEGAGD